MAQPYRTGAYRGYGFNRKLSHYAKDVSRIHSGFLEYYHLQNSSKFRWTEKQARGGKVMGQSSRVITVWSLEGKARPAHSFRLSGGAVIRRHTGGDGNPCRELCPYLLALYWYVYLKRLRVRRESLTKWRVIENLGLAVNVYHRDKLDDMVYVKMKPAMSKSTGTFFVAHKSGTMFNMTLEQFIGWVKSQPTVWQYQKSHKHGMDYI